MEHYAIPRIAGTNGSPPTTEYMKLVLSADKLHLTQGEYTTFQRLYTTEGHTHAFL